MLSIERLEGSYAEGDVLGTRVNGYGGKRWFDVGVSGFLLLFLLPFLLCVWVAVKVTSKGPGLYWSRRVGLGGGLFMMPKFRTMQVEAPSMPREAFDATCGYLTPIGQFLRKLSIDELPQLWSVVVGDMSLVGPRP
jgi:O-antigen biosynthesis protein WbqP